MKRWLDGNKRIGFTTAVVFLELNGRRFKASEADATIKPLANRVAGNRRIPIGAPHHAEKHGGLSLERTG